jgi:peptidoglycan/LPS O-acetylase OafA/YrhL
VSTQSISSNQPGPRVAGLDAIRFVAAVWVVLHHISPIPEPMIERPLGVWLNLLFNGPAAVMVFFVLSGFVIHHPFVHRPLGNPIPFWAQRWIRIGLPAGIMTLLTYRFHFLGVFPPWVGFRLQPLGNGAGFDDYSGLMWSLVAESIYYGLYPLLRVAGARVGWVRLATFALLPALALLMWQPRAQLFNHFTHWMAWILGLPAWLAGCALAESMVRRAATTSESRGSHAVLAWRIAVLACGLVASILKEHPWQGLPQIGYPWTLQPFALLVVGWLRAEILSFPVSAGGLARLLERGGRWSYSIYLAHMAGLSVWIALAGGRDLATAPWLGAILRTVLVLAVCYLFFLAVEWPGWQVARWTGRRLRAALTPDALNPA